MKIKIVLICISLIFTALGIALLIENYRAERNFYCVAQDTLHHDDITIRGNYGFEFHGREGFIKIDALIENKGIPTGSVRRTINFTFKTRKGNYILQSNKITTLPIDNAENNGFQHHAPPFFIVNNQELVIFTTNDGNHGKVIYFGNTPALYCNVIT